jgi:hypothetical protein
MRRLAGIAALAVALLAVVTRAWADHGVGLRTEGMSPIVTALVWAGAAFLVGMAVVGIVSVLARRRSDPPPDV